jgi:tetratricopeptide (TPR) repeat protein
MRALAGLSPEHCEISSAAGERLLGAVRAALEGRRSDAQRELAEAVMHDPERPVVHLIAAWVEQACRRYQHGLDALNRLSRAAPEAADEQRYVLSFALGWNHEAREVIERQVARGGSRRAVWLRRGATLLAQARDHAGALRYLQHQLEQSPGSANLQLSSGAVAERLGDWERARAHVLEAVRLAPERSSLRRAAAELLSGAGYFGQAVELARQADRAAPSEAGRTLHAELCLWAGDLEGAARHVGDAEDAWSLRVRAAIAVLRGDYEQALALLDASEKLGNAAEPEAELWRAEALLRLGRYDAASAAVDRALARSERYLFAAQLLRLLATIRAAPGKDSLLGKAALQELEDGCIEICPEAAEIFATGERLAIAEQIESVLARLAGNRSGRATWLGERESDPRPLRGRSGPRFASRAALDLLRVHPAEEVLRRLDEVASRYPESSLPVCHRGEANLRLGNVDEAERDLEHALSINPYTRWAYIGLGGVEILRGRYERALEILELGAERMRGVGPAAYVYRGEALRRLGRLEASIADLEMACELNPRRLGAWINLALAAGAAGRGAQADAVASRLVRQAPGLLSDAAHALGVLDWDSPTLDPEVRDRVLESALRLMRGNRSSSCHTYIASGAIRTVALGNELAFSDEIRKSLVEAESWLRLGRRERVRTGARELFRDVELVGLEAGLRRAIRLAIPPEEIAEARGRYARLGLATRIRAASAPYDGARQVILIVASSDADAELALEAEANENVRLLGELLGYPECCVDAFLRRMPRSTVPSPRSAFEAARAAWVARPEPRLNTLLFGLGVRFISFEPCRFDCRAALGVAAALARQLGRLDPQSVRRIDDELRCTVAIDTSNARARVVLDRQAATVASAEPLPAFAGDPLEGGRALADRLVGAWVAEDGMADPDAETLVIDFARL